MKDTAVAGRYAHALFLVTERRQETDRALVDLRALADVAKPDTRAGRALASRQVPLTDKRTVLRRVLEGKSLASVAMFADLLLRKHRFVDLPSIAEYFEGLVERKHGIQRATVASAVPLTDAERTRLHKELERLTGATVTLTPVIDPTLLGGVQVRLGDRLVDRSVKSMLESIEHQLLHAGS